MTKSLLFIAHAPSDNTRRIRDAALEGLRDPAIEGVDVVVKAPLETVTADVLLADAVLLQTTENIGYMGGLTKDFFDRCYNDLLGHKEGMPVATLIRAGLDGTGTKRALTGIYSGLGWRPIADLTVLHGGWDDDFIDIARDTGMALAAGVEAGVF